MRYSTEKSLIHWYKSQCLKKKYKFARWHETCLLNERPEIKRMVAGNRVMKELNECKDLYGPLSENNRRLILGMLKNPSGETWHGVKRIVITASPIITLEMALKMVAPSWVDEIPDSFTLRRAILYALNAQKEFHLREASWNLE